MRESETAPSGAARPHGAWAMRMTWIDLLFMHWPIAPATLRHLVPDAFEIETFEGQAWIGLIPFLMDDVRMRWLPGVPTTRRFPECNVRTYVHPRGRPDLPGVWFFSLDAASRLAVRTARYLWQLNYFYGKLAIERRDDEVNYAVERLDAPRAQMQCSWRVGAALPQSQPGELRHFATERYRLFSVSRAGRPYEGPIWHKPWPLRQATLLTLDDGLVHADGIDLDMSPLPITWHADRLDVHASMIRRV
jgi:uncharacterized protein YqjF (DUF2071 family)